MVSIASCKAECTLDMHISESIVASLLLEEEYVWALLGNASAMKAKQLDSGLCVSNAKVWNLKQSKTKSYPVLTHVNHWYLNLKYPCQ